MRIESLRKFTENRLPARLAPLNDPQAGEAAQRLIRSHRALDLSLPEAARLGLSQLIPALLAHSRENHFIKFDPWDSGILIKHFFGSQVLYQYNPFRDPRNRQASGQKPATVVTGKLPDFLAWETFPENESYLIWTAASGQRYGILVQPVPIVPDHLIIASLDYNPTKCCHEEQVMTPDRLADMNELLTHLTPLGYAMGFNGRGAGASVDHFHTQAVPSHFLPLINLIEARRVGLQAEIAGQNAVQLQMLDSRNFLSGSMILRHWLGLTAAYPADALLLEAEQPTLLQKYEQKIMNYFEKMHMTFNSIAWRSSNHCFREVFFPRGQEAILNQSIKAGYVEMSGMLVIPNKLVFDKIKKFEGEKGISEAGPKDKTAPIILKDLLSL